MSSSKSKPRIRSPQLSLLKGVGCVDVSIQDSVQPIEASIVGCFDVSVQNSAVKPVVVDEDHHPSRTSMMSSTPSTEPSMEKTTAVDDDNGSRSDKNDKDIHEVAVDVDAVVSPQI